MKATIVCVVLATCLTQLVLCQQACPYYVTEVDYPQPPLCSQCPEGTSVFYGHCRKNCPDGMVRTATTTCTEYDQILSETPALSVDRKEITTPCPEGYKVASQLSPFKCYQACPDTHFRVDEYTCLKFVSNVMNEAEYGVSQCKISEGNPGYRKSPYPDWGVLAEECTKQ